MGAARWAIAALVGAIAVAGLIAVLQSRDDSTVDRPANAPGVARTVALPPALEREVQRGNVVLLHSDPAPPRGYRRPSADLRAAGQAVIPRRQPSLEEPLTAVAADRQQSARRAAELRDFIDHWLGGR